MQSEKLYDLRQYFFMKDFIVFVEALDVEIKVLRVVSESTSSFFRL